MSGYNRGCGYGKHGYYKGIWCDSTYELAYLIYCLDHNIDIKRCKDSYEYNLNGKKHKYHPDFVVDEIIIEIKGYDRGDVSAKMKSLNNKPYKLLFLDDLLVMMDYVAKTYNKYFCKKNNNFYELYDEYKPKYEYKCSNCGKTFFRNKKLNTKEHFCCRKCAGIFRKHFNYKNIDTNKISESLKRYNEKKRNSNLKKEDVLKNINALDFYNKGWSERLRKYLNLKTRYGATYWLKVNIPELYNDIKNK